MPDEGELARQIELRGGDGDQAAASKGVAQGQVRDTADAESRFHRTLDRLGVFQLEQHVEQVSFRNHLRYVHDHELHLKLLLKFL